MLPPLPGQSDWLGEPRLAWAAHALGAVLKGAGDHARAAALQPCARGAPARGSAGCQRLQRGGGRGLGRGALVGLASRLGLGVRGRGG